MAAESVTLPFEGKKIRLGDRDFIVPALTMAQVQQFGEDLRRTFEVSALSPQEDRDMLLKIILAAVQRNYPDMSKEELAERLDLASMPTVFWQVMGYSGLVKKDGPTLVGETMAETSLETGAASSPKS